MNGINKIDVMMFLLDCWYEQDDIKLSEEVYLERKLTSIRISIKENIQYSGVDPLEEISNHLNKS